MQRLIPLCPNSDLTGVHTETFHLIGNTNEHHSQILAGSFSFYNKEDAKADLEIFKILLSNPSIDLSRKREFQVSKVYNISKQTQKRRAKVY